MSAIKPEVLDLTKHIDHSIHVLYTLIDKELSRSDKSFDIEYNGTTYMFYPSTTDNEMQDQYALKQFFIFSVIRDCIKVHDWTNVIALVSGANPEDYQIEICEEEVVSNLDENGKPISAKPLNEDNLLVQWQDQSKFKFEEDNV